MTMLEPFWPQIKIGPLLRGERDSRLYLWEFRNLSGAAGSLGAGVARRALELVRDPLLDARAAKTGKFYLFTSYEAYFDGLSAHREEISERLLRIAASQRLSEINAIQVPDIAIHVRRGDFPANWRSSSAWYRNALRALRAEEPMLGEARIFSDAKESDLADLLAEPDVSLSRSASALVDLITMSRARVLIGSCHSSFSAWASFLGGMPTLVDSAKAYSHFKLDIDRAPVWEFDGTNSLSFDMTLPKTS